MNPFKFNFITASSFQWLKGFHFSPKVNEADNGYNNLAWSTTQLISKTRVVTLKKSSLTNSEEAFSGERP